MISMISLILAQNLDMGVCSMFKLVFLVTLLSDPTMEWKPLDWMVKFPDLESCHQFGGFAVSTDHMTVPDENDILTKYKVRSYHCEKEDLVV